MIEQVVVTTYKRNELLYLCLEAIRREDPDINIDVCSDRGHVDDELIAITEQFAANLSITGESGSYGNSFNTLSSLRVAAHYAEIVHTIEDDTIIHPGYFTWARQQLQLGEYAAVCGRIRSPHITYWYESPCASWNAAALEIALEHLIPEYFAPTREAMQRVLDEKIFPQSKWKKGGAEQDGFLLRCIEHHEWKTNFPPKALATHLGWWGYNQPPSRERPQGSLRDRVQACRDMFKNVKQREYFFGQRITQDEVAGINGL